MAKSLFDHINAIFSDQRVTYFDELAEADKKTFSEYMVHRTISMNQNYLPIVNEIQQFYEFLGPREVYLVYSQVMPHGKEYLKYIKKSVKDEKYEFWLIALVAKYFSISRAEAETYVALFYKTDDGKADLRNICEQFGIEPKQIKKAKL